MTKPTQAQIEAIKEFARWVIQEGPWEGHDLDGLDVQDRAIKLGLLVETTYDPDKHGEGECDVEPGEPWYVFAPALTAAAEMGDGKTWGQKEFEAYIEEVTATAIAAEREACAKVCENIMVPDHMAAHIACDRIAAAIRARGT